MCEYEPLDHCARYLRLLDGGEFVVSCVILDDDVVDILSLRLDAVRLLQAKERLLRERLRCGRSCCNGGRHRDE